MVLGVLSDSHDNVWKLDLALPHLRKAQVILHCGDLCSPFIVKRMAEGLHGRDVHIVWGNNDGDPLTIAEIANAYDQVYLHGQLAELPHGPWPTVGGGQSCAPGQQAAPGDRQGPDRDEGRVGEASGSAAAVGAWESGSSRDDYVSG